MPKDITVDTKTGVIPGESVVLPSNDFIANAQMTREGADLHLTLPDGHSVIVEGYFAQNPPPDLVAAGGARLTPHLVDSFLLPAHPGEYAAAGNSANDASPAGKVTAVVGEAHIIRADGTQVPAAIGTQLHQGDVIETAKTGAVNIMFADNTAFAVSENARMSVDKFIYDTEQHNGTSFFSMLQGAFVYTSGLIGKSDPGNVNIETPVGTIGIRGTAFVGDILYSAGDGPGHESTIAIWDGSGYVKNAASLYELDHKFETGSFTDYRHAATPVADMDPKDFMRAHPYLDQVTDVPWRDELFHIFDQLHHHLQLQPPTIHHGMLQLHQGDGAQAASWEFQDSQQLSGGVYNAFLGGAAIQPLSPLLIQAGPGGAVVPIIGTNTNDTFAINDSNIEPSGGPEFLIAGFVHIDGGNGFDTLQVGTSTTPHIDVDPTIAHTWSIANIERIDLLDSAESFGNHVKISFMDIFDMTDSNHTLEVVAHAGIKESFIEVKGGGAPGVTTTVDALQHTTTYETTISSGGNDYPVTFIIHTGDGAAQSAISVANI